MLRVKKEKFIINTKAKRWEDIEMDIKGGIKEKLYKEQLSLCAYCERNLKEFHVDHFKKRDFFPDLTFDYENLFLSCNSNEHCARYKDLKVKLKKDDFKRLISPVEIDFEKVVYEDGVLASLDDNIDFTIESLNLNHAKLIELRKRIYQDFKRCIEVYKNYDERELSEMFCGFLDYFRYLKREYA